MDTTRCPVCKSDVVIEDEAIIGDMLNCVNCGKALELVSLHPPQAILMEGEDDDFDMDTDEEEEDLDDFDEDEDEDESEE